MNWWDYLVTQAFNPPVEPGIDIGTPFHTAITAIDPGKVVSETFGGFGARVDVKTASGLTEYYQHLDTIDPAVKVGSLVGAGEVLGLSGGQLKGGSRPNSRADSTGPHVEFGLLRGNQSLDPSGLIRQAATYSTNPNSGNWWDGLAGGLGGVAGKASADPLGINAAVTTFGHGIADAAVVGEKNTSAWLGRQAIAFFVAAVVLLVLFGNSKS